jgi:hypothetical protein
MAASIPGRGLSYCASFRAASMVAAITQSPNVVYRLMSVSGCAVSSGFRAVRVLNCALGAEPCGEQDDAARGR